MSKVTAESLTDQQCREYGKQSGARAYEAEVAMGLHIADHGEDGMHEARRLIAAAINARAAKPAPEFAANTVCGVPERGSLCMNPAGQCTRHARARGV